MATCSKQLRALGHVECYDGLDGDDDSVVLAPDEDEATCRLVVDAEPSPTFQPHAEVLGQVVLDLLLDLSLSCHAAPRIVS